MKIQQIVEDYRRQGYIRPSRPADYVDKEIADEAELAQAMVGLREDCYINVGRRRTQLMVQGPYECDLCDEKALVVCIMPPRPLDHLNICQECLQHISQVLREAEEEEARGQVNA